MFPNSERKVLAEASWSIFVCGSWMAAKNEQRCLSVVKTRDRGWWIWLLIQERKVHEWDSEPGNLVEVLTLLSRSALSISSLASSGPWAQDG